MTSSAKRLANISVDNGKNLRFEQKKNWISIYVIPALRLKQAIVNVMHWFCNLVRI